MSNSIHPGTSFRTALKAGGIAIPGAFNPLVGKMIARSGFQAAYLSGAAFSAGQLAVTDTGIFTLAQLVEETRRLCAAAEIPILVDADTGYSGDEGVQKAVQSLEAAGAAAIQIEDQVPAKLCGHLPGKQLVNKDEMCERIRIAVKSRRSADTVILARTDAVAVYGIDDAIARAKAYIDVGADAIFPEALTTHEEFKTFRAAIKMPLIANMTEFGKTPLMTMNEFRSLGYEGVLFPVTLLRIAMKTVENALKVLNSEGSQKNLIDEMFTRQELYQLLDYNAAVTQVALDPKK